MPTNKNLSINTLQDDLHAAICRVKALDCAMSAVYEDGVFDDVRFGFAQFFQDTIDRLETFETDLGEVKEAVDVAQKLAEMLEKRDKQGKSTSLTLAKIVKLCDVEKVVSMGS